MSPARSASAAGVAPVFAALGDATRLRLVARLCAEGPLPIARLTDGVPVTRQAVTKHLHALSRAGLVRSRRPARQRQRVWELRPQRLSEARSYLDAVAGQWDAALARLAAFVET